MKLPPLEALVTRHVWLSPMASMQSKDTFLQPGIRFEARNSFVSEISNHRKGPLVLHFGRRWQSTRSGQAHLMGRIGRMRRSRGTKIKRKVLKAFRWLFKGVENGTLGKGASIHR